MKELIERRRDIGEVSDCYDASDALESQALRIEELKAEIAALRNAMQQANTAIAAGDSIIADLRAQLAAAQQDAERYRFAKGRAYVGVNRHAKTYLWVLRGIFEVPGEDFDAAIDAAAEKEAGK